MQLLKQYFLGSVNRLDSAFPQKQLWDHRNNETYLYFKTLKELHFLSCEMFRENQVEKGYEIVIFRPTDPEAGVG